MWGAHGPNLLGMDRRRIALLAAGAASALVAVVMAVVVVLFVTGRGSTEDALPAPTPTVSSPASARATPTPEPPTPTPQPSASGESPDEAAPQAPAPAPPAPAPAPAPAPPTCSSDVLTCTNAIRSYNGLGTLSSNATLNAAAQACAERMAAAGSLEHSSATPGFGYWGENIAQGYGSAPAVFAGWMGSSGHKANILGAHYTQMGIGYVASGNWWCQQFGS